jgi:hypothetical protein
MAPAEQPDQVAPKATEDDALKVAIQNAGHARNNVAKIECLQKFSLDAEKDVE